jgi:predicted Fe-Mo cluster-binding NifX family protein
MKVAIESNDGITIKSPFLQTKGYLVYDIDESNIHNLGYRKNPGQKGKLQSKELAVSENLHSLLGDCNTIISRGMNRAELQSFKQEGKEVFITFKTSAKDAVNLVIRELLLNSERHH